MADMERTLVIVKPDAVRAGRIGAIIAAYDEAGLGIVAARLVPLSQDVARRFYAEHIEKPFFTELVDFVTSGPSLVMVVEGEGAIDRVREINGATDPVRADPHSLRGRFGTDITQNAVHGSDSPASAEREIEVMKHLLS